MLQASGLEKQTTGPVMQRAEKAHKPADMAGMSQLGGDWASSIGLLQRAASSGRKLGHSTCTHVYVDART